SKIARSTSEVVSAEAARESAEAAKKSAEAARESSEMIRRRLEAAAACGCALVRIDVPPGMSITAITQITDAGHYDDPDPACVRGKATQVFAASGKDYQVTWLGPEALLPPGSYVLAYRGPEGETLMMIRSRGVTQDFALSLPRHEQRDGFQFVAGGECGESGA